MIDNNRGFAIMSDAGEIFSYEEDYGNAHEYRLVLEQVYGIEGLKVWYADEAQKNKSEGAHDA